MALCHIRKYFTTVREMSQDCCLRIVKVSGSLTPGAMEMKPTTVFAVKMAPFQKNWVCLCV